MVFSRGATTDGDVTRETSRSVAWVTEPSTSFARRSVEKATSGLNFSIRAICEMSGGLKRSAAEMVGSSTMFSCSATAAPGAVEDVVHRRAPIATLRGESSVGSIRAVIDRSALWGRQRRGSMSGRTGC